MFENEHQLAQNQQQDNSNECLTLRLTVQRAGVSWVSNTCCQLCGAFAKQPKSMEDIGAERHTQRKYIGEGEMEMVVVVGGAKFAGR